VSSSKKLRSIGSWNYVQKTKNIGDVLSLSQFDIFEHGIHAHIPDTANIIRPGPKGTAPKLFLHFREALKYSTGGGPFQGMSNL